MHWSLLVNGSSIDTYKNPGFPFSLGPDPSYAKDLILLSFPYNHLQLLLLLHDQLLLSLNKIGHECRVNLRKDFLTAFFPREVEIF